jgi:hypothetical protein
MSQPILFLVKANGTKFMPEKIAVGAVTAGTHKPRIKIWLTRG